MDKDDLILISVDDHIIEPPDMFAGHLPKKYEADAPRLVHQDGGTDVWKFRGIAAPNVALNAVAGRPKEEYGLEPQGLDEIRPGCYDVHERVKDLSAGGDAPPDVMITLQPMNIVQAAADLLWSRTRRGRWRTSAGSCRRRSSASGSSPASSPTPRGAVGCAGEVQRGRRTSSSPTGPGLARPCPEPRL